MKIVRFLGRHLTGTLAAVFLIVFLFSVFRYTGLDAAGRSVHIGKEKPVVVIDAGHGRGRMRPYRGKTAGRIRQKSGTDK